MGNEECPECHGTGFVKDKDGSVRTCYTCLLSGKLDQHDKNPKDSGIRV